MASSIEITNIALLRIGANTINAFDEGTTEATIANAVWDTTRRAILRLHPWNCALKEAELAQSTGTPVARYKYIYQLPADFIRLITNRDDSDFKVQGRSIYTNKADCKILYIFDNVDTSSWDSSFVDLVADRLAYELAYPITKSTSLMQARAQVFADSLQKARSIDGSEDIFDSYAPYDSALISARF